MKSKSFRINRSVAIILLFILTFSFHSCTKSDNFSVTVGDLKPIKLLKPQTDIGKPLMQVLKERKTIRSISPKELPDQVLSNLLWAAFGINRSDSGKRTAPSAVNWQVIDVYVALQKGVYLYNAENHMLVPVLNRDIRENTFHTLQPKKGSIKDAPLNLVLVADSKKRNIFAVFTDKSEEDMYSASDAGFICQNVYLFCASEGLGAVVRAMINRPELRKLMGLRPEQKIILAQTVGYPD